MPILPLILCALILADLATTLYALHKWPQHAFENGVIMQPLVALAQKALPKAPIAARDVVLVVTAALSLAAVYALIPYLPYWPIWLAAILWQGRTVLLNFEVIRDMR